MNQDHDRGKARRLRVRPVSIVLILAMCLALVPLAAMAAPASAEPGLRQFLQSGQVTEGDGVHHLGLTLSPEGRYAQTPEAPALRSGAPLAASADLSSQLPPIGNQGSQGSCVAWATSYYYKTWVEKQEHTGWALTDTKHEFSPSFMYNQINGGYDNGSSFSDAFALLQNKGDVDIAEFPYSQSNWTNQPSSMQLQEAKQYRIPSGWTSFFNRSTNGPFSPANDITNAKAWLASGQMLVFAIPVYNDFPNYGSNPKKTYYDYNGSSSMAGGHGVGICGYDDNINPGGADADHKGGFKMVNSWGSSWNNNGFVYLSYDFVKRYTWEAWKMGDLAPDTPSITSLSAASGNVGSSINVNGANFGGLRRSAKVTFNGVSATQVTWTNEKVRATVPAGATTGPVVVSDWEGTASNGVTFTVGGTNPGPTVTSVSPAIANNSATVTLTVGGTGFASGCGVKLARTGYSDIVASGVQFVSSTQVTGSVNLSGASPGAWDVVVTNLDGKSGRLTGGFNTNPVITFYTISAAVSGGNGSVSPASQSVPSGGSASVSIAPDAGFHIASITDNSTSKPIANPYAITNVTASHSVVVTFAADGPGYTVTAVVGSGNGSVAPAAQLVQPGATTSITITPAGGFHVSAITDNGVGQVVASPYTIANVTEDHTVVVDFQPQMFFTVNASVVGGNGSVSPASQEVAAGGTASVAISPDPGFEIASVVDNGEARPVSNLYVITSVTGNHDVAVSFAEEAVGSTYYLAEGSTNHGFNMYISIANPNGAALQGDVTYMLPAGETRAETINLPAGSQTTLTNDHLLAVMGGPRDFSTKVEVAGAVLPLAVDRTMYWGGGKELEGRGGLEGHSSIAVTSSATTWYLPEGSSNWGFESWLLIENPGGTPANCAVTYMIENRGPRTVNHQVPANSRATFSMEEDIGRRDASVEVNSDVPVVAEHSMYRNGRRSGACSVGATAPSQEYYLTEGTTAWGFTTYILVQNPQDTDNTVSITYMTPGGTVNQSPFVMPAGSRKTIRVNDLVRNRDVSAVVHGSLPLVAERAMYWNGRGGDAATDSIGMASPHTAFYFPDGQTSAGRETWTLVQNPNDTDVTVDVTYLPAGGGAAVTRTETVRANTRKSFSMANQSGIKGRASIVVTCTSGQKITAERSMYWNNRDAGTNTIGGWSD
jgi:Papain family cysteine protease/Family of unknown function (DUF5719)/IPT/TIG domain/Divergent InlB B-repeat domain